MKFFRKANNVQFTQVGNRFQISGENKTMNRGEFAEACVKSVKGYIASKDANTSYDKGNDIPEENASVKSARFTLAEKVLGETFAEIVENYFRTTAAEKWIYVEEVEKAVAWYEMDASEFREYLNKFGMMDHGRIRGRKDTKEVKAWFTSMARA